MFSVTNAAPGQEFDSAFTVHNLDTVNANNLQMKLNITTDTKGLAGQLFLEIRNSANQCLLGCNGSYTLASANGLELLFNNIKPNETKNYVCVATTPEMNIKSKRWHLI